MSLSCPAVEQIYLLIKAVSECRAALSKGITHGCECLFTKINRKSPLSCRLPGSHSFQDMRSVRFRFRGKEKMAYCYLVTARELLSTLMFIVNGSTGQTIFFRLFLEPVRQGRQVNEEKRSVRGPNFMDVIISKTDRT